MGPTLAGSFVVASLPEPLPYDSARARALLDEAGWRERNRAAVRERDGRVLRFTAIVEEEPPFREMAVYIQDRFQRVGVEMAIQTLDLAHLLGRMKTGSFEAAFFLFVSEDLFLREWHLGEGAPLGFRNAEVVRLLERLSATRDPGAQDTVYRELTEIFRADVPITVLFPNVATIFAHRRLRGLSSPWHADPVWFMEDLWLEDRSDR